MTEQEQYEQYLVETGQKQAPAKPAPHLGDADYLQHMNEQIYGQGGLTPEKVGASAGNALAMGMPGLGAAVPKLAGTIKGAALEGGAMGAAQSPEDRLKGFLTGSAIQGGLKGVGTLAKKFGAAPKLAGQKLLGVNPEQASAYASNPAQAEELYQLSKNNPMGLSEAVKSQVRGGLDEAFETASQPALTRVEKAMLGKNVEVQPSMFSGTAAGKEIERSAALQPKTKTWNLPVEEKYSVSATPMSEQVKTTFPKDPQSWIRPDRYTATDVPVGSVDRSLVKSGPEAVIQEGYLPRGTQSIEQQLPTSERVGLAGKQILTAKRASQRAAFENQAKALNPLAYNASDDLEAIAAGRLKKAIENVAPSTAGDNAILEQAARYSSHARNALKNNPAAILTDSESLGSVPMRSMRQFMDTHGGTNLEGMAKSLGSARAINEPLAKGNLLERFISGPVGKAALRTSSGAEKLGGGGNKLAEFLAPIARQAAVSGARKPVPSAEELDEYERYLKETGQK